jgi:hypothetical protein
VSAWLEAFGRMAILQVIISMAPQQVAAVN